MKFITLLLALFSSSIWAASSFHFDQGLEDWGSWGEGLGHFDSTVGHKKKGSMRLSTDWGETQTVHYSWDDLKPGKYKITAYVRALDVQKHPDQSTFWHFFDKGDGTENVFTDLNGSYDWRKVEYTVVLTKPQFAIWFRLKSPGQVWVDDITLSPTSSLSKIDIGPSVNFISTHKEVPHSPKAKSLVVLLDFDKKNPENPFDSRPSKSGNSMGQITSKKYYNLKPNLFLNGNWSQYGRIEFDVYNGTENFPEFYLTLGDRLSNNYWSQLNHKTHLAPGWNHLSFSLTQLLGERGSHRFNRGLSLESIKKMFIVIDPNERLATTSKLYFDNLKLSYYPPPTPPKGIIAFDFTSQKDNEPSEFKKVTSQHLYNKERGFGFVNPKFWRVEDSQWASNSLRYSIGILDGGFKVKLPNGSYKMQLNIERLGYWDPSFWKDRMIYINGKPVFKETRSFAKDYLTDWLQFENTIPKPGDHPFDLYLKKLFTPLEFNFSVTEGEVFLEFDSDATGISLNTLVIWKSGADASAKEYLRQNNQRNKEEFNWMARLIKNDPVKKADEKLATLIDPSLILAPEGVKAAPEQEILMMAAVEEEVFQLIQLRSDKNISWTMSELTSKEGNKLPVSSIKFSEIIPQYVSPDLNHETYMLAGKYFSRLAQNQISPVKNLSSYVSLRAKASKEALPGIYEGKLSVLSGSSSKVVFPVKLTILPVALPEVEFPVGFFGPDPISYTYFSSMDMEKARKEYRHEALRLLGESGFTTFSGLPEVKLDTSVEDWSLDTGLLDETLTAANRAGMSKVYFSYGGKFPQQFLDGSLIPYGTEKSQYIAKVTPLLKDYLVRPGMPTIAHTFSDEASGYTDRVAEDVKVGEELKSSFPFLKLGGFSSLGEESTKTLRSFFDFGFYSNVSKAQLNSLKGNKKWGSYNASPGNLDDPRYTFGPGLFFARSKGLNHYLEWHASAVNNLPYYDLDGRESDVVMFLPHSDGELRPTIRYALAVEGLNSYRKLRVLEDAINRSKGSKQQRLEASAWLLKIKNGQWSSAENILKPAKEFEFKIFKNELSRHLNMLLNL